MPRPQLDMLGRAVGVGDGFCELIHPHHATLHVEAVVPIAGDRRDKGTGVGGAALEGGGQ